MVSDRGLSMDQVCNIADDTTPYACNSSIKTLLSNLENDVASAVMWFDANYMKLNESKCHFILATHSSQHYWIKVGEQVIWESHIEKLLGIIVDKTLRFNQHVTKLCKEASGKVTALKRLINIVPMERKKILMNSFVESQFSYCPLIWMFFDSRRLNTRINRIHERALRIVYKDYESTFDDLLVKNESVCVHHRNIQFVAIEMFKVKNGLASKMMMDLFKFKQYRNKRSFIIPYVKTEYMGKLSLRYFGPVVWEIMLPERFKSIKLLENFKKDIKKWVPDNCPCRLCKHYVASVGFIDVIE